MEDLLKVLNKIKEPKDEIFEALDILAVELLNPDEYEKFYPCLNNAYYNLVGIPNNQINNYKEIRA